MKKIYESPVAEVVSFEAMEQMAVLDLEKGKDISLALGEDFSIVEW